MPVVSQETSWTLTNISYMFGSFLMFHWVRGIPFEFNAGAYDNLNMWEQIDNGDQYTPTKKFLLCVPIVLFLLSTHYTHYDLTYFTINFLATLAVVIPKLPFVRDLANSRYFGEFFGDARANPLPVTSVANRFIFRHTRRVIVSSAFLDPLLVSCLSLSFLATLVSFGLRASLPAQVPLPRVRPSIRSSLHCVDFPSTEF